MLLATRKKPVIKISEITFDLEIINPIESKNLFGGCEYHYICNHSSTYGEGINTSGGSWLDTVVVTNNSYYGNSSWYSSNHIMNGGYSSDWDKANWGNDYNNNNYDPWVDPYANLDSNGDGILDTDDLDNNGINDSEQSIPNLPATVPMQLNTLGSCVSYAISFISNYLGNQTNPLNVAYNIDKTLGLAFNTALFQSTAFSSGLDPAQATQAIQSFFNTTPVTNIQQVTAALQAGHPVIANYITGQATPENGNTITAHEIVIVNYNQWNFQIANSLTGTYQWISQDLITFQNGAFEINSLRP